MFLYVFFCAFLYSFVIDYILYAMNFRFILTLKAFLPFSLDFGFFLCYHYAIHKKGVFL